MKLGELLVEAKLTESNFQFASVALISRYRDLEEIFDVSELPTRNGKQGGYQLIRGTLAAMPRVAVFVYCVMLGVRT